MIQNIQKLITKYHYKVPLNDIPINEFISSNSWFDIKQSSTFDFNNQLKINQIKNSDKIVKCKKVILLPNDKQTNILLDWLNSVRLMSKSLLMMIIWELYVLFTSNVQKK